MADFFFPQERQNARQIFPFPTEGSVATENPPVFCWIPAEGDPEYTVILRDADGGELERGQTRETYYVPGRFLPEGENLWELEAAGHTRGEIRYRIAGNAVKIRRVDAETLYDSVPDVRPRHLFFASDLGALRERRTELSVLARNVEEAYRNGIPDRPMFHREENALPYREYFGSFRDYCDRDLIACALFYAITGDEKAGAHGKKLLLTFADWNPDGPCSLLGPWGDEVGLSLARCLPSAYDLLFPLLDDRQKSYVAGAVRAYGMQCYVRLKRLNYCLNPGDSHAGRVPAYLGEAALVLRGSGVQTREEAIEWLHYALEIYGGIFPYYGTPDGGWAEGTFYATSYTKWYLPFFSAVERYGGTRFLDRPFYRNLTSFFLHFADPAHENHPFGDGYWCSSEDPEWPGFFAQNPFRFYADRFGPEAARKCSRALSEPELYRLHLLDLFLPTGKSGAVPQAEEPRNTVAFPDAGFVALHTDFSAQEDLCVLARASKFGSDSHRHPDQGSFALFAGGNAMISPSGYFGRQYGTLHHREWLNSTRAHNAILIDGAGQAQNSMESRGRILSVREDGEVREAVLDLTAAYPMLSKWERRLTLTDGLLTVTDLVEADHPVTVTYPLHTLSEPRTIGEDVVAERGGYRLTVHPIAGVSRPVVTDRYAVELNAGEPEQYHVTMPPQYHISYTGDAKKVHRITVEYRVEKQRDR